MNTDAPHSDTASSPVYMMLPPEQRGVALADLVSVLWQRKWLIAGITALSAAAGVAYALLATPIYRAEAVLAPNRMEDVPNLPAGLTGLAGLAGVSLGSSTDSMETVAVLNSRAFAEEFITDENLLPVLFADEWDPKLQRWIGDDPEEWPDIRDGVELFIEDVRFVDEDITTGLVTFSIEWTDPQLTAAWLDRLIGRINVRLRERALEDSERRLAYLKEQLEQTSLVDLRGAISRLIEREIQTIMLANSEADYAFKVIDPPRVPRKKIAPRRTLVVVVATLAGGVLSVLIAISLYAVSNRRSTPRATA